MAKDTPRLLHRRSQYAYTDRLDQAVFDEPEAVSAQDQDWITYRAQRSALDAQVQEWARRRAVIEGELEWLYSQRLYRDVRTSLRSLQRDLDRLDKRISTAGSLAPGVQ